MLPIKIKIEDDKPPDVAARRYREFSKRGFEVAAAWWHQALLPEHFQQFAAAKYRYKPRTKKYLDRKRKLAERGIVKDGGRLPLVFSGTMRDLMVRAAVIRGFPTRATLRMEAPRYVTFRPKANQPDKVAEVTRVLPAQQQRLEEIYRDHVEGELKDFREKKTISV
jgi:hypothetical protein